MIKVSQVVRELVGASEEASWALNEKVLNLAAFAQKIHKEVEERSRKSVRKGSIVTALSRMRNEKKHKAQALVVDVKIEDLTIKSPLLELTFDKTPKGIEALKRFYADYELVPGEFVTVTQGTDEITIVASSKAAASIEAIFGESKAKVEGLVGVSVRFSEEFVAIPNVIFSLIRKLAIKRIFVMEIVSTYSELTFIVRAEDLQRVVECLSK